MHLCDVLLATDMADRSFLQTEKKDEPRTAAADNEDTGATGKWTREKPFAQNGETEQRVGSRSLQEPEKKTLSTQGKAGDRAN